MVSRASTFRVSALPVSSRTKICMSAGSWAPRRRSANACCNTAICASRSAALTTSRANRSLKSASCLSCFAICARRSSRPARSAAISASRSASSASRSASRALASSSFCVGHASRCAGRASCRPVEEAPHHHVRPQVCGPHGRPAGRAHLPPLQRRLDASAAEDVLARLAAAENRVLEHLEADRTVKRRGDGTGTRELVTAQAHGCAGAGPE
mmetsp:Transcript_82004/g.227368  ORF Transcript_82004/g.227368 Transcript_82004/m.227368 type:complete len:212 (+) Transcript_82004:319-954(+)